MQSAAPDDILSMHENRCGLSCTENQSAGGCHWELYFEDLAEQLHYTYLGTFSKGEAAGVCIFPKMFKKLLTSLADLGAANEKTHMFDPDIARKLAQPVTFSKRHFRLLRAVQLLHLDNIGWHRVLRKNKTFHLRLERPYA